MTKQANTNGPIIDVIRNRWSPRSYSTRQITPADMNTILEAASWAPSASNEQPWEYYYAFNGTEGFQKLHDGLVPFNQTWAKNASVLVAAVARKNFAANGNSNKWAQHDLGMANATLFLQASAMDIHAHGMGGFDSHIISLALDLGEDKELVCMIALGYLDEADKLAEPYRTRELAPRERKPLADFAKQI